MAKAVSIILPVLFTRDASSPTITARLSFVRTSWSFAATGKRIRTLPIDTTLLGSSA
jgi:hypothetical protein